MQIIHIALRGKAKKQFNQLHSRYTIPLFDSFDLSFFDHVYCFNPAQGSSGTIERLEPHHWFHNWLDVCVILFNYIEQIFALPQFGLFGDRLLLLERFHCCWVSGILIYGNHPCSLGVLSFQDFAKKSHRCRSDLASALNRKSRVLPRESTARSRYFHKPSRSYLICGHTMQLP